MMDWQTWVSIFLGIGLAASAGFRVFVPLFALSLAGYFGLLPLNAQWQWVASTPALIILAIACIAESMAYLIPFVDHALDALAVPLAGIAGTAVMASTMTDVSPAMTWALAIIGGGGSAALIRGVAATGRVASTATTGGLANPVVSIAETGTAIGLSALAIFLPVVAAIAAVLVAVLILWGIRAIRNRQRNRLLQP